MIKLALVLVAVGFAAAQFNNNMMRMLMMQNMMSQSGTGGGSTSGTSSAGSSNPLAALGGGLGGMGASSGGSSSGGLMGSLAGLMNNPVLMCRRTENLRMVPCNRWRGLCDMMSISTYGFPGLLKCSPVGVGCCIKDALSYHFIQTL